MQTRPALLALLPYTKNAVNIRILLMDGVVALLSILLLHLPLGARYVTVVGALRHPEQVVLPWMRPAVEEPRLAQLVASLSVVWVFT